MERHGDFGRKPEPPRAEISDDCFRRWIELRSSRVAYRKPNLFTRRIFNPLAMKLGIGGTKALSVRRRRSGRTQRVPVIPIERDGARYLVSPRGETDWVKNLRAASEGELGGERFHASEVPVGERAPIVDRYQEIAGRSVASHFKALPDPADHPVFRIDAV